MKRNCCNVLFVFIFSIILLQSFAFNAMATEGGPVSFFAIIEGSAKGFTNVVHVYMAKNPATKPLSIPIQSTDVPSVYYALDSVEVWDWKIGDIVVMVITQDSNTTGTDHNGYYAVASHAMCNWTSGLDFPKESPSATEVYYMNLKPIPVPSVASGAGRQAVLTWNLPVEDTLADDDDSRCYPLSPQNLPKNIIGYNIWRSTTGVGKASFTKIASNVTGLTYTDTTVGANEGYYYALEPVFIGSVSYGIFSANSAYFPSFTITASAGTGGTISPSGSVSVNSGESKTFTIAPAACYDVDNVLVNGSAVTLTNGQYTFPPVTANQTISATFKQNPCCTYSVQAQIDSAKQEGIQSCKDNPASCGLFNQTQLDAAVKAEQLKWDANGDGKMGLEDVIRILQVLAGLRP